MSEKYLLVSTVKNEGPNILEWVAYHRVIGFDTIHIYQNDSTDETQKTLRTLDKMGAIKYFRNHCPRKQWQNKAYRRSSFHEDYSTHDWCMTLDGDEFLNIKAGDHRVQALTNILPDAVEIRLNWRNFSCSGHLDLSSELVIDRYSHTDAPSRINKIRAGIKTLFRTAEFKRPGIHKPRLPQSNGQTAYNGSGINCDLIKNATWRSTDPGNRALAQINHYPVRDMASYLLKTDRGSSSHVNREVRLKYWTQFNRYNAEDTSIQHLSDRVQAEMAVLNQTSRGRLFRLREHSLNLWKEKLAELMKREDIRDLRDDLLATIPEEFKAAPIMRQDTKPKTASRPADLLRTKKMAKAA